MSYMGFVEDLREEVKKIFRESWTRRNGYFIPTVESLGLGNDTVNLSGITVLYADMADSTKLVENYGPLFSAEVYKTFLISCVRIIKNHRGQITAYDGDRVMAIFDSVEHSTDAVKTALKINWAVTNVINPALKAQYPDKSFVLKHGVGIDSSDLQVARVGIRNSNDLVWVGKSANYAAKLSELREGLYPTWISDTVYDRLENVAKTTDGKNMWEQYKWTKQGDRRIYRSSWSWGL